MVGKSESYSKDTHISTYAIMQLAHFNKMNMLAYVVLFIDT